METDKAVNDEQRLIQDLVQHEGWALARKRLTDLILVLQDVSEYSDIIQTGNATRLLKEMKANKRTAEILFSWLADLEGTAQSGKDTPPAPKSYIYSEE